VNGTHDDFRGFHQRALDAHWIQRVRENPQRELRTPLTAPSDRLGLQPMHGLGTIAGHSLRLPTNTSASNYAMNKVTPRDFRNAFLAVLESERDNFRAAVGFESKSYNFFMRTTIYPRVARQLGLLSWNKEYYTLDGMLYEERGVDETGRYATYANWISVAIEHENDSARAHEKMNKLQSFNAPLKVLITYAAEGAASETLLRKYESLIKTSDVFNDVATLRQQLVILGTPKTARDWRFYAYENDGFVLMLPDGNR
jgi:hypothetical protein